MYSIKRFLFTLTLLSSSFLTFAQNLPANAEKCGAALIHNKLMETDPEYKARILENEATIQRIISSQEQNPSSSAAGIVYTVPIVVHVMHIGSAVGTNENISNDQIYSAITALNEDYRKKPGTNGAGNGVDVEIEFCLATKNPSGTALPYGAINRINASGVSDYATNGITYNAGTNNQVTIKGLSKWDNTKYYNIWLVTEINGNDGEDGTQGYAYFPGNSATVDGAVILYNAFGTIGNVKSYTDRNSVATHEIGHGLDLYHTFQGDDGDGVTRVCPSTSNCSSTGDYVCDTPPHIRTASICPADNTVNSCTGGTAGEHIHNYMDYSREDCVNMFTAGQSTRMRAVLGTGGPRASLCTSTNLNASGCNGANPPAPLFSATPTTNTSNDNGPITPCEGSPTQFTDESLYSPTSWNWTFEGGTPATSTQQNPVIVFNGAGPYDVTLISTNQYGSNTITKSDYVIPIPIKILPYSENFEGATFPPTGISITNPVDVNDVLWARTTTASGFGSGSGSAVLGNDQYSGAVASNSMILPPLSFSNIVTPQLSFDIAYERFYFTDQTDSLIVSYSIDCGKTFTRTSYKKGYSNLYTSDYSQSGNTGKYNCNPRPPCGTTFIPYVPPANQWRKEVISLSSLSDQSNVIIKLERGSAANGPCNYLYIDNIDVKDVGVPIANFIASPTSICVGNSVVFTDKSKGKITTYSWNFGDGASMPTATTQGPHTVTYATPGLKTVVLTVSGPNGTDLETKTSYINVLGPPTTSSISGLAEVCVGDVEITYSVSGTSGSTFAWTVPTGSTIASGQGSNAINVNFGSTNGNITVLETNAGGCSGTLQSKSITIHELPQASTGGAKSMCIGGSVQLGTSAVSGNSYNWSPTTGLSSAAISNPTANPTSTTTYSLTEVNTTTGCKKTNSATVTVNPLPAAATGTDKTICESESVAIGATTVSGSTYSWTPSDGLNSTVLSSPVASPTTTTTYSLTETITATGCVKSNSVTVVVNPRPVANAGTAKSMCSGSTAVQLGDAATSGYTYKWTPISSGLSNESISNPTAAPSSTTAYTLEVSITSTGCKRSNSVTVTVNPLPAASTGVDKSICAGASTTIGAATVSGNTYSWSPSTGLSSATVSNPTANPTSTRAYTLTETVTATGCLKSNSVNVTVNPLPVAYTGGNQNVCTGNSVTMGAAAVSGNTYKWTTPPSPTTSSTSSQYTVSPATTTKYMLQETVTLTGCTKTDSATITPVAPVPGVPVSVTISANPGNVVCNGAVVTFTATTSSGGTNPDFQWKNNGTNISGATSSTYSTTTLANGNQITCQMTSKLSCASAGSNPATSNIITMTVNPIPASPVAGANNGGVICDGTNLNLTASLVSGATYSWTGPDNFSSTSQNPQITAFSASKVGTYNVKASKDGCTSPEGSVTVSLGALPAANAGANTSMCMNSSVVIGAATVAGSTYSWNPTTALSSATVSNPTANPTSTLTYTLTETVTASGCSKSNNVTVTVNPLPAANAGVNKNICTGSKVIIGTTAVAGNTYNWSPSTDLSSATISNPEAAPTSTINYTLTETNVASGCSNSNTITVTVNSPTKAVIIADGPTTFCSGGSVTLTANVGTSYLWSNGATTSSITVSTSGNYTVTVTYASGCSSTSEPVAVELSGNAVAGNAESTDNEVCSGNSTKLTLSGNTGDIQWEKSTDNTTFTDVAGATGSSYTTPLMTSRTYYRARVSNSGCPVVYSNVIDIKVTPAADGGTASTTNGVICKGNDAVIDLTGYTGNIQWQQSEDNVQFVVINGATADKLTVTSPEQTFYVRAQLSSGNCAVSHSNVIKIEVNNQLVGGEAIADFSSVCEGSTAQISLSGYTGNIQWEESTDNINFSAIFGKSEDVLQTNPINEVMFFRAKLSGGSCSEQYSNVIEITPEVPPIGGTINADNNEYCEKGTATITLTNSRGFIQWQESLDGITFTDIIGQETTTLSTGEITTDHYYRAVLSSGNCDDVYSDIIEVLIVDNPVAAFIASATTVTLPNATVTFNDQSIDAFSYTWDFGDGTSSIKDNPSHLYTIAGKYTVKLEVLNNDGCGHSITKTNYIEVKAKPDTVGITDRGLMELIKVYPNPTTGKLNIQLPSAIELNYLQVFDMQGREVISIIDPKRAIENPDLIMLDLNGLSNGVYFLRANSKGQLIIRQVEIID